MLRLSGYGSSWDYCERVHCGSGVGIGLQANTLELWSTFDFLIVLLNDDAEAHQNCGFPFNSTNRAFAICSIKKKMSVVDQGDS
jgi:hypothetical protein